MDKKILQKLKSKTQVLIGMSIVVILINLLLLILIGNISRSIKLLRTEEQHLKREVALAAQTVTALPQYDAFTEAVSGIFPTEETLPRFIDTVELIIKSVTSSYTPLRLLSPVPQKEDDKLFLLYAFTFRGNIESGEKLLNRIELLPYFIHIISISGRTPSGLHGSDSEIGITFKVYVQNPFTK